MPQDPQAPALTGDETAEDIRTDYSRSTSKNFTSYLNRDHAIIQSLLQSSGGGLGAGVGRLTGRDYTVGRAELVPEDLRLLIPNASYLIGGVLYTIDEPGPGLLVDIPANMAAGKYGYLTPAGEGALTVLTANWRSTSTAVDMLDVYPCVGFVKSDDEAGLSITHAATDEILTPANLLFYIKSLQAQIDAIGVGGEEGGGGSIGRADLLPWDATDLSVFTKPKVLELIDSLRSELKDYVDQGNTKPMQVDNDHFVEMLMRLFASVARLSPEATDLIEAAMVLPGFAGHSLSGDFADPGVNDTTNHLRYTSMHIDAPNRTMLP